MRSGSAPIGQEDRPGETIDVAIARVIGRTTRFQTVTATANGDVRTSFSYENANSINASEASPLNFYKQLLVLRRTEPALVSGGYVTINPDDPNVFAFLRHYLGNGRSVLVALNMSDKPQMVTYDLSAQGVTGGVGLMLLNSYGYESKQIRLDHMTIPPFGVAVIGVR